MNRKEREEFQDEILARAGASLERIERTLVERATPRVDRPVIRDALATYDRLGRKQPHKLHFLHMLRGIPAMWEFVNLVPPRAIAEHGDDELGTFALIECPCGHKPIARAGLSKCNGCERYYCVAPGSVVLVAYGDMPIPGATASD